MTKPEVTLFLKPKTFTHCDVHFVIIKHSEPELNLRHTAFLKIVSEVNNQKATTLWRNKRNFFLLEKFKSQFVCLLQNILYFSKNDFTVVSLSDHPSDSFQYTLLGTDDFLPFREFLLYGFIGGNKHCYFKSTETEIFCKSSNYMDVFKIVGVIYRWHGLTVLEYWISIHFIKDEMELRMTFGPFADLINLLSVVNFSTWVVRIYN